MLTNQTQVRDAFWNAMFPNEKPKGYRTKRQNDFPAAIRCAFVDFVDHLAREGEISEALAQRVTL